MKNRNINRLEDAKLSFNILCYTTTLISGCYGHFCAKSNATNYFNTSAAVTASVSAAMILLSIIKMQKMTHAIRNGDTPYNLFKSLSLFLLGTSGLVLTGLGATAYNAAYFFTNVSNTYGLTTTPQPNLLTLK